jgi:hypothetical protein
MEESGQERLLFEDRLRALGGFIDRRGLHAISLVMEDELVSLKARRSDTNEQVPDISMNREEIAALCREAYGRRGSGMSRPAGARPSRLSALRQGSNARMPLSQWIDQTQLLSYQELLRAVGFDLDRAQVQSFRLDEFESGLILRVWKEGDGPEVQQVHPLSKEELRARIAQSLRRRGHRRPSALTANSAAS